MKNDGWEKAKRIFADAVKLEPEIRLQYLIEVCADDTDTRCEVESLLASFDDAESFLETPAAGEFPSVIKSGGKQLGTGKCFGHYEIIEQIGVGGMGEVYLAADKKLDRKVAVKILNEKFSRDESNLGRFTREAKAASALNHPNILVIHEIGETDEANYIVSEYVEGKTLRERLKESSLKLSEVLDIAIQIVSALTVAHFSNIVHRDIKPENVMIRPDGYVKILDFGLAKLVEQKAIGFEASTIQQNQTEKGMILGTVNYMSPEQAKAERVDEQTDIFSLGVVVYEMIAGRTPFAGNTMSETFANLINAEPLPLPRFAANVPDEMQRIVSKMLRKNKDERYQTMKDLLSDLKDLRENLAFDSRLEKSHLRSDGKATAILLPPTGDANEQTAETRDNFTQQIKQHKSLAALALIALLVGAIGLGYYFIAEKKSLTSADGKKSIAVLPFVNASQDPNAEYLSDGITESIINNLSQLAGLKVMSRNSAFRFKNNQNDPRNIAAQLGVETLVTGDIRQIGDRLVINVRLIDASDDSQIWGNQYVKTSTDIISSQNEIAQAVANNLRLKLTNSEQQRLGKNYTENVEAYQLYLRGRYHYYKLTQPEIRKSIDFYQKAIQIDPNYALAYAGMADAYRTLPLAGRNVASKEALPQAKAVAERALEIDFNLAEAHIVLGWVGFLYDWDWKASEAEFKRAIELAPNNSEAHRGYAHLLSNTGRHDEAVAEGRRAREFDPLNLITNALEGQFLYYAGRYEEAIDRLQKTLELDPNFWIAHGVLGRVYILQKRYAEAIAELNKARELSSGSTEPIAHLGYALAKSGNREQAQATLAELKSLAAENYVPAYNFAIIYNGLGEKEEALNYLERSFQEREVQISFVKIDTRWDEFRAAPRFIEIIKRMNLQ